MPVWTHVLAVALQLLLLLAALLLIHHVSAWTVTAPGPLQLVVVSCRYYLLSRYLDILIRYILHSNTMLMFSPRTRLTDALYIEKEIPKNSSV